MVARIFIIASVACAFINLASGLKEPFPGFKPCLSRDNKCMTQNAKDGLLSFVDGLPEYGVKGSDPDYYDKIDASTNNLKFILKHVTITGLRTCKVNRVERDVDKSTILLELQCDLKLAGDYEMKGRLLIIDLEGKGRIEAELPSMLNTVTCNYVMKTGKDGKEYIRVKNYEHTYKLQKKTTLKFDGLYPHNEVLGKAASDVITKNPDEVVHEIGLEVFKAVIKRLVGHVNNFAGAIPYNELALD
nr:odorant-binding protein 25 [Peridroma saucia]